MARPALSSDEVESMRSSMIEAAFTLYKQEGMEAVSFRRLAASMCISHTLPYRYFDSKEALFAAVRIECFQRFFEVVKNKDQLEKGPVQRFYGLARAVIEYLEARPAEFRLMFALRQPPLAQYPELLRIRQEAFDYLVAIVQQAADVGLVDRDPRTVMHIAWATTHGLLGLHSADQLVHGRKLDELIEPMVEMVLGPVFGAEPEQTGESV